MNDNKFNKDTDKYDADYDAFVCAVELVLFLILVYLFAKYIY